MTSDQNKIDQLTAFKERDKFSDGAWNDRGLNPSATEVSLKLTALFNHCADTLIKAVQNNASHKQLNTLFKSQLTNINKRNYDTEEKEFICDLFYELAQILNIDFADNLNRWLYGSTINTLLKIQAALNPVKVLDTIKQTCSTCGGALDTFIMQKEEGIPDFGWNIVQCKSCKDYALVSFGPDIKKVRYENYILIEQLPKKDFSKEQAQIRLEQVRHFRK